MNELKQQLNKVVAYLQKQRATPQSQVSRLQPYAAAERGKPEKSEGETEYSYYSDEDSLKSASPQHNEL